MSLNTIWSAYQDAGLKAAESVAAATLESRLYLALLAFSEAQYTTAAAHAAAAVQAAPDRLLPKAAETYLQRVLREGKERVYVSGEAFGVFIRNGGNVGLYQAVSANLRRTYDDYTRLDLLDIGVGDGLALLPALAPSIARLDLVEPSAAMLNKAGLELYEMEIPYNAYNEPIQQFMLHGQGPWDLMQATFSLQSLAPDERAKVLPWLCSHGARLLIAEFDLPDLGERLSPAQARYMIRRYERGLGEYNEDDLVAQGFLMPIFFSAFDRESPENYEQPIELWEFELRSAGYTNIEMRQIFDYWWAPAYMIDAS
ncbi:MAG: class I SAM-dependent methyltransferase [Oscillochloris sp.]|nr:class I SAM-dependent methyltransferase [Oscillochloris sp.]